MNRVFQYNDGGRKQSSYPFERLDCSVRAYALAMNISYDKSHKIFELSGRKNQKRFHFHTIARNTPGVTKLQITRRQWVKTFLKTNYYRNIVIRISGHVFCVKNNITLDKMDNSKCIVTNVWIFSEY